MKKSSKKILVFSVSLIILSILSSCNRKIDSDEKTKSPGTNVYTGVSKGFGGDIEISLTLENNKIIDLVVKGEKETEGIGTKAIEELPQKIIDSNSTEVESISGATVTSTGIKEAVSLAMLNANKSIDEDVTQIDMMPGTYIGKSKGYAGTLEVSVDVSENKILSIEVINNIPQENEMIDREFWASKYSVAMLSDTPQILKTVTDRLPDRIVKSQSLSVDTITGATASSNGVINAVKDAIIQAGGNPLAFNKNIENNTEEEVYETDVVVIGGGTSGASAAAAAKDNGAKVILIEKSGRVGGTGSLSSQPMTFNSKLQQENDIISDEDEVFQEWLSQTHWYVNGNILRKFMKSTGSTVDWLADKGFNWTLTPGITNLVDYEDDSLNSMGVAESFESLVSNVDEVLYETTAKTLIQEESGKVVGVEAEKYDGTKVKVKAKSVVIATGGFLGNMDLMKKYNNGHTYEIFGLTQNIGEGFEMALDAGAIEWNAGGVCGHLTDVAGRVEGFNIQDTSIPYTLSITPTLLKVNSRGERFMDESSKEDSMTISTNFAFANGRYNYTIVSKKQLEALKKEGLMGTGMETVPAGAHFFLQPLEPTYKMENIEAVFEEGEKIGLVYSGETLEDLAKKTGMDSKTLVTNIDRYNKMCENRKDDYFNKSDKYMDHLGDTGPYYAIKSVPLAYSSLGGVKIDENMQVLDLNGQNIQGLYAVGMDAVGVIMDGVAYPNLFGMALGWGFNSGRIGGLEAANSALNN